MRFFSRLTPKLFVVMGCVAAIFAAVLLGLAWLQSPPDPSAIKQMRGVVQSLEITDIGRGAVRLSLAPGRSESIGENAPERPLPTSFSFRAKEWVDEKALYGASAAGPGATALIDYLERPLGEVAAAVRIGEETLLDPYAPSVIAERDQKLAQGAGFALLTALFVGLGVAAHLAQRGAEPAPEPDRVLSAGLAIWLMLGGVAASMMATSNLAWLGALLGDGLTGLGDGLTGAPARLIAALIVFIILLPWLPGCFAIASIALSAHAEGRTGKLALFGQIFGGLFARDGARRKRSLLALWFFLYLIVALIIGALAAA